MSEISEVFNNKLTKLHDCAVALEEHMLQPNTSDTSQSLQEMGKKAKTINYATSWKVFTSQ